MGHLVVLAYDDESRAEAVRQELARLEEWHWLDLDDAVVAIKTRDGRIRLNQPVHLSAAGAFAGGILGGLVGTLFLSPVLGATPGAGAGAVTGAAADIGIPDDFIRRLAKELAPGTSALFLLVETEHPHHVIERIREFGGTVIDTDLTPEQRARLEAALRGEPKSDEA